MWSHLKPRKKEHELWEAVGGLGALAVVLASWWVGFAYSFSECLSATCRDMQWWSYMIALYPINEVLSWWRGPYTTLGWLVAFLFRTAVIMYAVGRIAGWAARQLHKQKG